MNNLIQTIEYIYLAVLVVVWVFLVLTGCYQMVRALRNTNRDERTIL